MKRLILLLLLMIPFAVHAQGFGYYTTLDEGSMTVSDSITWTTFYTEKPGSIHYNYSNFDAADAVLGIYQSDFPPDSNLYELVFIDLDKDGTNDNPFTLSDSSKIVTFDSWPCKYRVDVITSGSVTGTKVLSWIGVRSRKWGF